jgi:protein involved in polysaccharide export with SLBB domain
MNKKNVLIFTVLCALTAIFTAVGQTQSQSPQPSQSSTQTPEQSMPTSGSDPSTDIAGRKRYLVGPGDLIDVRVFGQPDLSSQVEIDDEGNISSLPFIEDPIRAMCRNEKDIQKSIATAYSKYIKSPRVSVRVIERRSRPPAVVFGAVRSPTRVQMMRRVHLHELLVVAGGVTLTASGTIQIIHTEKEMCPQDIEPEDLAAEYAKQGNDTTDENAGPVPDSEKTSPAAKPSKSPMVASSYNGASGTPAKTPSTGVNADDAGTQPGSKPGSDKPITDIGKIEIYQTGDVRQGFAHDDPLIRPGDIVIVTEGEPIYLNGALSAPREIVMKDGMTLGRAIAMAGGLQKLAKSHEVYVYRQVKGKLGPEKLVIDYDAIKEGKIPDFPLQAYDIVDVRMQGSFTPGSLGQLLKGMATGGMSNLGTSAAYRVIY